jgi:O-antigen/teichoic acid export membrane protein
MTLRDKSVAGIKWLTLLSVLASPLAYGVNVLFGKLGPEILGTYGLVMLLSTLIPTFLLFGGNQVVVRFLPTLPSNKKLGFLASYGALVTALAAVALIFVWANPSVVAYLSQRDLQRDWLPLLVALAPVLLLLHLATGTLWAEMEIKWMTICQKSHTLLIFLGAAAVYLWSGLNAVASLQRYVIGLVVVAFGLALAFTLYVLYTRVLAHLPARIEWFLPPGFWHFAGAIYLGTIFWLALERFDQALVWSQLSVAGLGLYRAPLATAEMVRWLPKIAGQVAFPLFATLLAQGSAERILISYRLATKYATLAASLIALPLILFAPQVLTLFGDSYREGGLLLTILAGAFTLSAIATINTGLLVAHGRARLIVLNGLLPGLVQLPVAVLLIGPLGLTGAALGKAAAIGTYTLTNTLIVARIWHMAPDRKTWLILVVDAAVIAVAQFTGTGQPFLQIALDAGLLIAFAVALVLLGVLDQQDWQRFTNLLQVRGSVGPLILQPLDAPASRNVGVPTTAGTWRPTDEARAQPYR